MTLLPSDMANEGVRIAAEEFGIELDYSVESLGSVDELLEDFPNRGYEASEIGDRVRAFGFYAGEVLVRQTGAKWRAIAGDAFLEEHFDPALGFVVDLKTTIANPIGKVWKRLENGAEDSLLGFARTTLAFHAQGSE
jgi:hypothetical protein